MKKIIISMILVSGLIMCGCDKIMSAFGEESSNNDSKKESTATDVMKDAEEQEESEKEKEETVKEEKSNNYNYNKENPNGITGDVGNLIDNLRDGSFLPSGYTVDNLLEDGRYSILEEYDNGTMVSVEVKEYNEAPDSVIYYIFIAKTSNEEFYMEKIEYKYENGDGCVIDDPEGLNRELLRLFENFEDNYGGGY